MDLAIKNPGINESTLIWAIIASMLLHISLVVVIPNFNFETAKEIPQILKIELQKPEPLAPVVIPEPPKPIEPPKPEPIKKVVKPKPIEKLIETPSPIQEEEVAPPPVVNEVIAVKPTVETQPEIVIPPPPPDPPKPPEPSQVDIDDALGEYGNTLGRAIARHKSYPKIAQTRGWQGEVLLDLKLDGDGNMLSAKVRNSSGYEALDKQALDMVRKASPFPPQPLALRNRSFNITVPVSF
ncbi:MAG: energy transducer TonB, partial [Methylophilaceae bacterium]